MLKKTILRTRQTIRIAFRALARNKMRSFLTALGIIIGVGAVIAMVSIGEGAKKGIQDRFASMGQNLLFVVPGSRNVGGVRSGSGGWQSLKEEDAKAILKECDAVLNISPSVNSRGQVIYGNKNWYTQVQGVGEKFPEVRSWVMDSGTFFDEGQVKAGAKVCVLGADVKTNLFGDEDPIGKIIRIRSIPFRVIGVFKSRGESFGFGSRDDMIAAPYTTVLRRLNRQDYLGSIDVSAVSGDKLAEAQSQMEALLRVRHRLLPGADDDFTVRNMSDIAESAADATKTMTVLLGSIASISLLVGGIGIMNIMLVSVTERIREIGIRLAVGARERDILLQFLIEAVMLSVLGGGIGILFGVAAAKLVHNISMFSTMTTVVTTQSVLMAFGFAAAVGIFFGFYPAKKASRLDPIEALRFE